MTGDLVVQRPAAGRWRRAGTWWPVLRVALLLLWIGWAALSWWTAPRQADAARATADLAAGRVAAVQWGDDWDDDSGTWDWTDRPSLRSSGSNGPVLAWRTADWRVHYTVTPAPDASWASDEFSGSQAAALGRAVASAGLQPGSVTSSVPQTLLGAFGFAMGLSALVLLVGGPAPVTGTRWFWWWLITWAPLGLGLVYWLARERPWSRTAEAPSGPPDRENRRRWYVALGLSFLASVLVAMVTFVLHRLLGDAIVPQPGG